MKYFAVIATLLLLCSMSSAQTGVFTDNFDSRSEPVSVVTALPSGSTSLATDPTHQWSIRFGGGYDEVCESVATDAPGNVFVTGAFEGTVDFGGGQLTSAGYTDAFVAKFDPNGNHLWSMRFGSSNYDQGISIATDATGNVLVAGKFRGTVDFGGGPLVSPDFEVVFVARFDTNGNHIWSQRIGQSASVTAQSITADNAGNVIITGYMFGPTDFGGGLLAFDGYTDIFVAKYDPSGAHLWSSSFGSPAYDGGSCVAADAAGNVLVTGYFKDTVDFGGGPLANEGYQDIFVAKFDAGGSHIWSKRFGDARPDYSECIATDMDGNVFLAGYFDRTVDFGGGPLTSAGDFDVFVAKLDSGGNHLWSQRYGSTRDERGHGVAVDLDGRVLLTGYFYGATDFGGGSLTSEGGADLFVATFDANGTHLWSESHGGIEWVAGRSIATDTAGNVLVAGYFGGTADFGGEPLTSAGNVDVFIARYGSSDIGGPFVDATVGPLGDAGSGQGVAWGDYDNDGDLDLYVANIDGANKLIRNDGVAGFVDATTGPLDDVGDGFGVAWGDYDNDEDLDLYLVNYGQANKLFRNDGGGSFADVTSGPLGDIGFGIGLAWGDYDNDGDIDLYFSNSGQANKLLRNDGGGTFIDATSGPLGSVDDGRGVAWGDYDNDGDLDLYLANYDAANKLFRNDGGGIFVDATAGPLGSVDKSLGGAWGDYDNDGDLDLYLTNVAAANRLLRNDGPSGFVDATNGPLGSPGTDASAAWGDYDNDGDLDLCFTGDYPGNVLLRNEGSDSFTDMTRDPMGDAWGIDRGVAWADYDSDGDLDLYVASAIGENKLFRNESSNVHHWLQVKLQGTISNRAGIGARVEVAAGGTTQIRELSGGSIVSQDALVASFGLGSDSTVESLTVRWPSGNVQIVDPISIVDQKITVVETQGPTGVNSPDSDRLPTVSRLYSPVPNPFNPSTTIQFDLLQTDRVELAIYDMAGRRVRTLVQGMHSAGRHRVVWRGESDHGGQAASGVYLCRIETGAFVETRRMVLVK